MFVIPSFPQLLVVFNGKEWQATIISATVQGSLLFGGSMHYARKQLKVLMNNNCELQKKLKKRNKIG
jgi:hypothetical protein